MLALYLILSSFAISSACPYFSTACSRLSTIDRPTKIRHDVRFVSKMSKKKILRRISTYHQHQPTKQSATLQLSTSAHATKHHLYSVPPSRHLIHSPLPIKKNPHNPQQKSQQQPPLSQKEISPPSHPPTHPLTPQTPLDSNSLSLKPR